MEEKNLTDVRPEHNQNALSEAAPQKSGKSSAGKFRLEFVFWVAVLAGIAAVICIKFVDKIFSYPESYHELHHDLPFTTGGTAGKVVPISREPGGPLGNVYPDEPFNRQGDESGWQCK